jgi:hypothetical protein
MHWHIAVDAKYYLIVIFIVSTAADCTTSIILRKLNPLLKCKIFNVSFQFFPFCNVSLILILDHIERIHLVHDLSVSHFVHSLLRQLEFFQKIDLQFAWIVDVEQEQAQVLSVPVNVLHHVLRERRIDIGYELLAILVDFFWPIHRLVSVLL